MSTYRAPTSMYSSYQCTKSSHENTQRSHHAGRVPVNTRTALMRFKVSDGSNQVLSCCDCSNCVNREVVIFAEIKRANRYGLSHKRSERFLDEVERTSSWYWRNPLTWTISERRSNGGSHRRREVVTEEAQLLSWRRASLISERTMVKRMKVSIHPTIQRLQEFI